jgi:hypothetical protein
MKSRMLVGAVLFVGVTGVGTFASSGAHVAPHKRWAIVNFTDPVTLQGHVLMGRYLIVHDDAKMARGEECTSIQRFDAEKGPQETEVAFMCEPAQRSVCEKTTISVTYDPALGIRKLTGYQFAGDAELHGVPSR